METVEEPIFQEQQPKEGCKKCNQKPTSRSQYITIFVGFYLLLAAIYGTVVIIKNIISLF
jgi:hypothetical protein